MKAWTMLLFYIAAAGWCMAFVAHILSWCGVDVAGKMPLVWLLHLGVFVVWIPAIIQLNLRQDGLKNRGDQGNKLSRRKQMIKLLFMNTPAWLRVIAVVCFVYAPVNFIFFALNHPGSVSFEHGHYVLEDHGKFIRMITADEYHLYSANEIRMFSGHWLFFYAIAAASSFPFGKREVIK